MESVHRGDEKIKMFYVFLMSTIALVVVFCILCYFIIANKKITKKTLKILSLILIVALALVAYCIEPKETNDLYRHFRDINVMRKEGLAAVNKFDNLIIVKLLFGLITLLPNNHFLPVITVTITYGILAYIVCDFHKRKDTTSRVIAIAILLSFALCTFYMTASGIRNAMACAFLALGLYLDLIREEKFIKKIWPYIIALLIHPISYIIIGVRLLFQIKWIEKLKYFILMIGIIYRPLISLFKFINIGITNYLAQKMELYLVKESIEDIRWIAIILVFLVVIYIITILLKKKNKNTEYKRYLNFIQLYILLIYACLFMADIFVKRLTFLLAFFIVPLIYLIENNFNQKQKMITYGIIIFFLCGLIPYSVIEFKNTGFIFWK